ncbi:MAG: hypothetical protein ACPGWR_21595 [Ardenticatenaceae bacterium]
MSSQFSYKNIGQSGYDADASSSSYLSPAPTVSLPVSAAKAPPTYSSPVTGDLERLRDILFGNQNRTTEQRVSDLENRLEGTHRQLSEMFHDKIDTLQSSYSNNLSSTRNALTQQLEEQMSEQTSSLRTIEHALSEKLDQQEFDRKTELRSFQKNVNERVEELAEDIFTQLRNIQRELTEQLEHMNSEQSDGLRSLQNENRKQNNNMRQELLSLAASLQDSKVGGHDLGLILQEVGQRLRSDPHTMR